MAWYRKSCNKVSKQGIFVAYKYLFLSKSPQIRSIFNSVLVHMTKAPYGLSIRLMRKICQIIDSLNMKNKISLNSISGPAICVSKYNIRWYKWLETNADILSQQYFDSFLAHHQCRKSSVFLFSTPCDILSCNNEQKSRYYEYPSNVTTNTYPQTLTRL